MQSVVSLVFAVVPMMLYLWVIWMMDRYDREPIGLLALNFLWGAVGAYLTGLLVSVALTSAWALPKQTQVLLLAPIVEEVTKGVFLLWTARNKNFDNITDGVVYGMAIGLGFGMTENFVYFFQAETAEKWVQRVMIRTLFTALMHAMATGTFGVGIGLSKYRFRRLRVPISLLSMAVAILLHRSWNLLYNPDEGTEGIAMVMMGLSLAIILLVMQVSLYTENQIILRELLAEARSGLLPQVHLNYLPYSSKRKILGWLSPAIDRKRYVSLATRLAFRKFQSRYARGAEQDQLAEEIASLRSDIRLILSTDAASPAARLY